MKNGKVLILLMTAVFLLLSLGISFLEPAPQPEKEVNIPLSVTAVLDGEKVQIRCWENTAGDYFLFLPSWTDVSDLTVSVEPGLQVVLEQKPLEAGMKLSGLQTDTPYALACTAEGVTTEHTLTLMQSARLPSLHLDVQSGSMDIIHETKGNQESGSLRLYSEEGQLAYSGWMESLKGRGNSSWYKAKKPYSVTLAREADLLGMGQAREWILLANAMDPSHLRNKAAYDLADKAGMTFTPECQWVDLYLNGEYAGLYLLSERNEIHSQRVDLQEAGSFLVSREPRRRLTSQNYPCVIVDSGAALRIYQSGVTEEELYRIWQPIDNAIFSADGRDQASGNTWQKWIDLDSWAMNYLIAEAFGNADAGVGSTFYYRDGADPSGKIYAGPVWDYDLSMGNQATWQAREAYAFFTDREHIWGMNDSTWEYGLNRKPEFRSRVRELYKTVCRPLLLELLQTGFEEYAEHIQQGARLDQCRWGTAGAAEETEYICRYLTERMTFLDSIWLEDIQYCRVLVMLNEHTNSLTHAVLPGECVPWLPEYTESWDVLGWYDADTDQPFDITQPIYRDTVVYLKRLPGEEDQMSPLQIVPIAVVLCILLVIIPIDRKRRGRLPGNAEKQIAKRTEM